MQEVEIPAQQQQQVLMPMEPVLFTSKAKGQIDSATVFQYSCGTDAANIKFTAKGDAEFKGEIISRRWYAQHFGKRKRPPNYTGNGECSLTVKQAYKANDSGIYSNCGTNFVTRPQ